VIVGTEALGGARIEIKSQLLSLVKAALTVADNPPVDERDVVAATPTMSKREVGVLAAFRLVKGLRAWAVELNTQHATADHECLPEDGTKVEYCAVPATHRENGRPGGQVLSADYLASNRAWNFNSVDLIRAYRARDLTHRIKVGRAYAYQFAELCALRLKRQNKRNDPNS
jgi:hypothetical protein